MDESSAGKEVVSSPVGNLAELKGKEILLPDFMLQRSDGLFVEVDRLVESTGRFEHFVDQVFGAGNFFEGLDYPLFQQLLYGEKEEVEKLPPLVRLSDGIAEFLPERSQLYKTIKVLGADEAAEYVFEPVALERVLREPIYGEAGEDGNRVVTGFQEVMVSEPTRLAFDEFVADMWQKGVRYGLRHEELRRIIREGDTARIQIARGLAPTPGTDATVEEETDALHRDDSPKILPNGKVDLRHFKNRYPQIAKDALLLKKIPRRLGKPGRTISGALIEPELPADFSLSDLAGEGTRVESRRDGEYIVANLDGFLNLDTSTSQVSVTEKIVNREGVSLRTTGDLSLSGDDYEDHGEVQERRVVEGKNMTFHGPVYGTLLSKGGTIRLTSNIAGGKASSPDGMICVEGRATCSLLEAPGGEVQLEYAEGCTIVASRVRVERAVLCQIVAERADLDVVEGCAIAAKAMRIGSCRARKEVETVASVLVPDLANLDDWLNRLQSKLADVEAERESRRRQFDELRGQKEFGSFLSLQARLNKGELKLSPSQAANWQQVAAKFAPDVQRLRQLNEGINAAKQESENLMRERDALLARKREITEGIRCVIQEVAGEVTVQTMAYHPEMELLVDTQFQDILAGLRNLAEREKRLFSGEKGSFDWSGKPEEPAP